MSFTGGSNAGFDSPKRLAIRMSAFEPGIIKFFPDIRQVVLVSAEHINAKSARDLYLHLRRGLTNCQRIHLLTLVYSPYFFATWPIAIRPSGVISPAAMRGMTEKVPFR
jgi:hypothetical protein